MRKIITFLSIILYKIVCVLTYIYIKANDVELSYLVTSYGQCQTGNGHFSLFQGFSITDCVVQCGLRPRCMALNFRSQGNICELFSSDSGSTIKGGRCLLVKRSDIRNIKTPCKRCFGGQICDADSKLCIHKECKHSPKLKNGKVLGNRKEVGMTLRYTCDYGFKRNNNVHGAKCLQSGKWNQTAGCARGCRTDWVLFNGSCYLFSVEMLSWYEAKDYCKSKRSTLVSVKDDAVHQFITEQLEEINAASAFWIGGRYNATTRSYKWLDGSSVGTSNLGLVTTDTMDGCMMYSLGGWKWTASDNFRCTDISLRFICEA
ncbi:uncharacterized protein LOC123560316 [Mercenaria mercenaria]|uniref:uncharacterized protein LOC123560316 n=1 Tax=Mercenaria mercenaria TaxID=6596 RepID=UPI00234F2DED|nr:uncharacterized protein LOC123560316 [Mercenaria mercenaria]